MASTDVKLPSPYTVPLLFMFFFILSQFLIIYILQIIQHCAAQTPGWSFVYRFLVFCNITLQYYFYFAGSLHLASQHPSIGLYKGLYLTHLGGIPFFSGPSAPKLVSTFYGKVLYNWVICLTPTCTVLGLLPLWRGYGETDDTLG